VLRVSRRSKALNQWCLAVGDAWDRLQALADAGVQVKMLEQPPAEYDAIRLFGAYQPLRSGRQPIEGAFGGIPISEATHVFDRLGLVEFCDLTEWWSLVGLLEKQAWDFYESQRPKS